MSQLSTEHMAQPFGWKIKVEMDAQNEWSRTRSSRGIEENERKTQRKVIMNASEWQQRRWRRHKSNSNSNNGNQLESKWRRNGSIGIKRYRQKMSFYYVLLHRSLRTCVNIVYFVALVYFQFFSVTFSVVAQQMNNIGSLFRFDLFECKQNHMRIEGASLLLKILSWKNFHFRSRWQWLQLQLIIYWFVNREKQREKKSGNI